MRSLRSHIPTALAVLATAVVAASALGAGGTEFVGAETCATCHPKAYETWRAGPHARAVERLSKAQAQDPRCLRCHAPEQSEGLTGVQCESCHGAGQFYFPEYVMRDPELARLVGLQDVDAQTCARCHDANSPSLVPFDYGKNLERIRHWEEGAD